MNSGAENEAGEVVLFPLRSRDPEVKALRVARVPEGQLDKANVQHFAGGPYKGIIVSKATQEFVSEEKPHATREFLAHVQDVKSDSDKEIKEKRKVLMWFEEGIENTKTHADVFFKNLIDPDNFPKDYISFVKKVILLARATPPIRSVELVMSPAAGYCASPPVSPSYGHVFNSEYMGKKGVLTSSQDTEQDQNGDPSRRTQEDFRRIEDGQMSPTGQYINGKYVGSAMSPGGLLRDAPLGREEEPSSPTDHTDDPSRRTQEDFRRIEDGQMSPTGQYINGKYVGSAMSPGGLLRDAPLGREEEPSSPTDHTDDPSRRTQEDFRRIEDGQMSPTGQYINGRYVGSAMSADGSSRDAPTDRNGEPGSPSQNTEDPLGRTQEDFRRTEDGQENSAMDSINGQYLGSAPGPDGSPRRLLRTEQVREDSTGGVAPALPDPTLTGEELVTKRQEILVVLEDAFPSALTEADIARMVKINVIQTSLILQTFKDKNLAQPLDKGRWIRVSTIKRRRRSDRVSGSYSTRASYARTSSIREDFQVVPQMPILPDNEQPSIAFVTLFYCEKQAIDSMMEHKTTYVRYKTEGSGENQVYTVGVMGPHKVVSTKLSRIGTGQGATMSAGNTVTRLLGTFGKVEHVFLVGVGGSIPNYDDDTQHVRCGDLVISKPGFPEAPTYVNVTDVTAEGGGNVDFSTQFWAPKNGAVADIVATMSEDCGPDSLTGTALAKYLAVGLADMGGQELSFTRPPPDEDRLHRVDSDGAWEEIPHPDPAPDSARALYPDRPMVHFGSVGAGYDKLVKGASDWRQEFALANDVKALDSGYQAVMDSIEGNRTDSFWVVRGIADYADGVLGVEWRPYASLVAAAAAKLILLSMPRKDSDRGW